jgi:hypothetical protein
MPVAFSMTEIMKNITYTSKLTLSVSRPQRSPRANQAFL